MRYVETQSMQIGASYVIQFSLVMGCGQKYTAHMDNQVKLQYSTNHGLTWHLVQEVRMGFPFFLIIFLFIHFTPGHGPMPPHLPVSCSLPLHYSSEKDGPTSSPSQLIKLYQD